MPYQVVLKERPIGYAAEHAAGIEGHPAKVIVREFSSSEDGDLFISRLEGWPTNIINQLPQDVFVRPSEIDHLVAIIANDLSTTVYINELPIVATIIASAAFAAG